MIHNWLVITFRLSVECRKKKQILALIRIVMCVVNGCNEQKKQTKNEYWKTKIMLIIKFQCQSIDDNFNKRRLC